MLALDRRKRILQASPIPVSRARHDLVGAADLALGGVADRAVPDPANQNRPHRKGLLPNQPPQREPLRIPLPLKALLPNLQRLYQPLPNLALRSPHLPNPTLPDPANRTRDTTPADPARTDRPRARKGEVSGVEYPGRRRG